MIVAGIMIDKLALWFCFGSTAFFHVRTISQHMSPPEKKKGLALHSPKASKNKNKYILCGTVEMFISVTCLILLHLMTPFQCIFTWHVYDMIYVNSNMHTQASQFLILVSKPSRRGNCCHDFAEKCKSVSTAETPESVATHGSCASYGCGSFKKTQTCQCDLMKKTVHIHV